MIQTEGSWSNGAGGVCTSDTPPHERCIIPSESTTRMEDRRPKLEGSIPFDVAIRIADLIRCDVAGWYTGTLASPVADRTVQYCADCTSQSHSHCIMHLYNAARNVLYASTALDYTSV